jgi:hypothetical protein
MKALLRGRQVCGWHTGREASSFAQVCRGSFAAPRIASHRLIMNTEACRLRCPRRWARSNAHLSAQGHVCDGSTIATIKLPSSPVRTVTLESPWGMGSLSSTDSDHHTFFPFRAPPRLRYVIFNPSYHYHPWQCLVSLATFGSRLHPACTVAIPFCLAAWYSLAASKSHG